MEKKEPVKISLPLFITIIVLLVAVISGIYVFIQNQKLDKEIAGLKEQISKTQAEKNELQDKNTELKGKLDNISNTINSNSESKTTSTNSNKNDEITYDYELTIRQIEEELKSTNYDDSNNKMREFSKKYDNKKIKISGYVSYADDNNSDEVVWADEYEGRTGSVSLGEKDTYKTKSRVLGYTGDMNEINKISKLQQGQEITIIGTVVPGTYLNLKDIVIK